MAITYIGSSTDFTNNGSSSSVTPHASAQLGDLMLVCVSHRMGSGGTISAPNGWTQINSQQNSTTVLGVAFFRRFIAEGDLSAHVFDFGATGKGATVMVVWRGVDSTTPVLHAVAQVNSSQANIPIPVLTVSAQEMGLSIFAAKAEGAAHNALSSPWVLDGDVSTGGGATGTRNRTTHHQRTFSSANPPSQTVTSSSNAVSVGFQIALAEEEAGAEEKEGAAALSLTAEPLGEGATGRLAAASIVGELAIVASGISSQDSRTTPPYQIPEALVAATGDWNSTDVARVQDDPDNPDALFLELASGETGKISFRFPAPAYQLDATANAQKLRARLENPDTSAHSFVLRLLEFVDSAWVEAAASSPTPIDPETGSVVELPFSVAALVDPSGANVAVEVELV